MKKTYSQPECLVVTLSTNQMMAESLPIDSTDDTTNVITDKDEILTKGSKSIWDDQW